MYQVVKLMIFQQ